MELSQRPSQPPVDPPNGTFSATVDGKGRCKLAASIARYLRGFEQNRHFVTTVNRTTAQIYDAEAWRWNRDFLNEPKTTAEQTRRAQHVLFIANHYGQDQEVDEQARITIPADLRRELGIEDAKVWLQVVGRRVEIMSDAVYQERLKDALGAAKEDAEAMFVQGML